MYSQPLGNHVLWIFLQSTFRKPYAANLLALSDLTLDRSFKVKLGWVSIKVSISRLLLVLEVSNVQLTFRKPYAANLLVLSDLTLDRSFNVKLGWVSIKVPIYRLLLVLEFSNVQSTFRKPYVVNLLVMSDSTMDGSFQVKLGRINIKVPIFRLLLILEVAMYCQPLENHMLWICWWCQIRPWTAPSRSSWGGST